MVSVSALASISLASLLSTQGHLHSVIAAATCDNAMAHVEISHVGIGVAVVDSFKPVLAQVCTCITTAHMHSNLCM